MITTLLNISESWEISPFQSKSYSIIKWEKSITPKISSENNNSDVVFIEDGYLCKFKNKLEYSFVS